MATLTTGLPATALTGLELHQLDFIKRFRYLIVVPPLPRLSQRDLESADDRLWGPAPHSSPSPIRPLPLIVCLRQTSGTAAPAQQRPVDAPAFHLVPNLLERVAGARQSPAEGKLAAASRPATGRPRHRPTAWRIPA